MTAQRGRRRCLVAAAAWMAGATTSPLRAEPVAASAMAATSDAVRRQLRFTVSLRNPLAEELRDQRVWFYVPAGETPTQRLVDLKVSMDHELLSDPLGHRIVKLQLPRLGALSEKRVTVLAEVALQPEPAASPLLERAAWLGAERHVEVDDPRIRSQAAQLRREHDRDTAHAIYDWVRTQLHYAGYIADDLGALYALTERRGDCTEYAYLAVALARANGIPARMVGGFVAERSIAPRAEEYHNWAEVHVDGAWRLLDAQKEHWLAPAQQYIAFRFCSDRELNPIGRAHRFRVDGGMQVRL